MDAKFEIHRLVDALPASKLPEVKVYLERLGSRPSMEDYLNSAPYDDEALTDAQREAVKVGLDQIRRGETSSREEILRELGLE